MDGKTGGGLPDMQPENTVVKSLMPEPGAPNAKELESSAQMAPI